MTVDKQTYLLQQTNYLVNEVLTELEHGTDLSEFNPNFSKSLEAILFNRLKRVYSDVEDANKNRYPPHHCVTCGEKCDHCGKSD